MFDLYIINSDGIYEKVADNLTSTQAAGLKKALIRRGLFAQICKQGNFKIIG